MSKFTKVDNFLNSNKINANIFLILFLEFIILMAINDLLFAGIFQTLQFVVMCSYFILILLGSKNHNGKVKRRIVIISLVIIIILPVLILCNIPKYTYREAASYLGEARRSKGAASFSYSDIKRSTFSKGRSRNLLTMKVYLIEAEIDGKFYIYFFNPYTCEYSEGKLDISNNDITKYKDKNKYKVLY